ncbi:MAG: cupin [Methylocystis sp.]|nr:MAG: cupin [Methylocystis sp.]
MSGLSNLAAEEVARLLDLAPHPEGGFYRETFRDPREVDGRSVGTAIYYLLPEGQVSAWHRVDAGEIWHWHAGAPLELSLHEEGRRSVLRLGADLLAGERPQGVVPAGVWQSARSLGAWTLVGCTVAPGFEFAHFEIAAPGQLPNA